MPKPTRNLVIVGRNTVHDALAADKPIQTVLMAVENRPDPKLTEIEKLAHQKQIKIERVTSAELFNLSDRSSHQGVIAFMDQLVPPTLKEIINSKPNPFILLINSIDYEQNLGAIMRTAWAAGVDAVVVSPSGVHQVTPVVAKVSMGGVIYVPLISQSLFQALTIIRDHAIPVCGVEVGMGKTYDQAKLAGPIAMVFGGEASGLTEPLQKYCNFTVHIPMVKEIASLNVSVATAVAVFEKRRQDSLVS